MVNQNLEECIENLAFWKFQPNHPPPLYLSIEHTEVWLVVYLAVSPDRTHRGEANDWVRRFALCLTIGCLTLTSPLSGGGGVKKQLCTAPNSAEAPARLKLSLPTSQLLAINAGAPRRRSSRRRISS